MNHTVTDHLTTLEKQALELCRERGQVRLGQRMDKQAVLRGMQQCEVFTPVAMGLHRRGLVDIFRPEKIGPKYMTLRAKHGT